MEKGGEDEKAFSWSQVGGRVKSSPVPGRVVGIDGEVRS